MFFKNYYSKIFSNYIILDIHDRKKVRNMILTKTKLFNLITKQLYYYDHNKKVKLKQIFVYESSYTSFCKSGDIRFGMIDSKYVGKIKYNKRFGPNRDFIFLGVEDNTKQPPISNRFYSFDEEIIVLVFGKLMHLMYHERHILFSPKRTKKFNKQSITEILRSNIGYIDPQKRGRIVKYPNFLIK